MRIRSIAVLSVALLPGLLVLPVASPASPRPVPVEPSVQRVPVTGTPDATASATAPAGRRPAAMTERLATEPFDLVGVTWQAGTEPDGLVVQARVRQGGRWSAWELLEAVDEGPDDGTAEAERAAARTGTSPLVAFDAEGVQVRVDSADGSAPRDLRADLVHGGRSPADTPAALPAASANAASAPPIITRAQWGADESLTDGPHRVNNDLKAMILHHTAGSNSYTRSEAYAQLRGIYAYHTKTLGWADIGYNLVVDRYGRVFEGRRGSITAAVRGAHAGGFNTDTFGLAVMGDFEKAALPTAALDAVVATTAWKLGQYGVDPRGTSLLVSQGGGTSRYSAGTAVRVRNVSGHRDVGLTACPGDYFYGHLGSIRTRTAALAPGTARITWPAHPRDWDGDREADVLAVDRDGGLHLYPGTGTGGFDSRRQVGHGWSGMGLVTATGDLDGDRRPDLVARRDATGELYLYRGDGRGRFLEGRRLGPGWDGMRALLGPGDWNGDGLRDLLAVDAAGALWFYAGNGAGGFRAAQRVSTGWEGVDLLTAVGDLDTRGTPDLVGRRSSGELVLYRGNASGGFSSSTVVGRGWGAFTGLLGPGDWDGAGGADLLGRRGDGTLWLYSGNGLGSFASGRQIGRGWGAMRLVG
ncbi:MAG: FG-GAP-like repeat-containing protein [Actinomycetes bacterium]